jgi:hypothetical protein
MDIGLDFDGVIAAAGRLKSAVLHERFGIVIPPESCRREIIVDSGYVAERTYEEMKRLVFEDADTHDRLEPIEGALETIRELLVLEHRVRIITSRSKLSGLLVERWLEARQLPLEVAAVGRDKSKTKECRGLDVYVDDDLDKLLELERVRRRYLLGGKPHIRPSWIDIRRVGNWHALAVQLLGHVRVA